jgi:hypothetical protein
MDHHHRLRDRARLSGRRLADVPRRSRLLGERLLVLAILLLVAGVPACITWMKGHKGAFWIGLLLFGVVWAKRFYGPDKMDRARRRFGEDFLAGERL